MLISEIIALGWAACLFVDWYNWLAWKNKRPGVKPFDCQMCMGFWIGFFVFAIQFILMSSIANFASVFIYALLTSLAASLEYAIIRRI